MSTFFAGLDWASRTHAVCVIDEHGSVHAVRDRARRRRPGRTAPRCPPRASRPWPSSAPRA